MTPLLLLLTLGQAEPAAPTPPAPPSPVEAVDPTPDRLTWEELPASLRALAEPMIGRKSFQSVVTVETPVDADSAARTVAYGDLLLRQTVRPAAAVRLKDAPNGKPGKYGPAGALLWQARDGEGDHWCWRDPAKAQSNVYCLRDKEADGRFDVLYENTLQKWGAISRFLVTWRGKDEGLQAPVAYEPATEVPPYSETIAVRYVGPGTGRVTDDGRVVDGVAGFELVVVAAPNTPAPKGNALVTVVGGPARFEPLRRLPVRLDAEGRGEWKDVSGLRFFVDRVSVDGDATVRLVSGLPTGEGVLNPPLTREALLEDLSEFLDASGKPKATAAP